MLARELLYDLVNRIHDINDEVLWFDRKIYALVRHMKEAQKLMSIPSVEEHSATAIVATISDGKQFQTSRKFAAWPRQYTTGVHVQLGLISKRGDKHIRTLLIQDARAIIVRCKDKTDRNSLWVQQLAERRGYKRLAVALVAKNARIIWALLTSGNEYQANYFCG